MIFEVVGTDINDLQSKIDTYIRVLGEPKSISIIDKNDKNSRHPKRAALEYDKNDKIGKVN